MLTNYYIAILTNRHPQRESKFVHYIDRGRMEKFFEGETIAKGCNGDDDPYLYYIVSGKVKICYQRSDCSELVLFYRERGNIFQAEYKRFASICSDRLRFIAAENTVAVAFTKAQVYELFCEDKELLDEFLLTVHLTYASFAQRLVNTAYLTSGTRLLTWLNKLCAFSEPTEEGYYELPCDLTQQQIADLLFIHVSTCNKLFSFLEKENLVKKTKNHIVVYDWLKLREYLETEEIFWLENKK